MKRRYPFLDCLRGLALYYMIVYHFCYDIYVVSGVDIAWPYGLGVQIWQRSGLWLFVLVSGMSFALMSEKARWRAGLKLNALGLAITTVTYFFMPEELVVFGVLNFFGCAFWLTQALVTCKGKLASWLLVPLGITPLGFYSADYVPLWPHIVFFWLGVLLLPWLRKNYPQALAWGDCKFLTYPGQHSLFIYLVHQPIILFCLGLIKI